MLRQVASVKHHDAEENDHVREPVERRIQKCTVFGHIARGPPKLHRFVTWGLFARVEAANELHVGTAGIPDLLYPAEVEAVPSFARRIAPYEVGQISIHDTPRNIADDLSAALGEAVLIWVATWMRA